MIIRFNVVASLLGFFLAGVALYSLNHCTFVFAYLSFVSVSAVADGEKVHVREEIFNIRNSGS